MQKTESNSEEDAREFLQALNNSGLNIPALDDLRDERYWRPEMNRVIAEVMDEYVFKKSGHKPVMRISAQSLIQRMDTLGGFGNAARSFINDNVEEINDDRFVCSELILRGIKAEAVSELDGAAITAIRSSRDNSQFVMNLYFKISAPRIKGHIIRFLQFKGQSKDIKSQLVRLYQEMIPKVPMETVLKFTIANAIAETCLPEFTSDVMRFILDMKNGTDRGIMLQRLLRFKKTPGIDELLLRLLADKEPWMQGAAIQAVWKHGQVNAIPMLEKLNQSENLKVRKAAEKVIRAFGKMRSRGATTD